MRGLPKICRHSSGLAFVIICGRRYYLKRHGSPEAEQRYNELVGAWVAAGRPKGWRDSSQGPPSRTLDSLVEPYLNHARVHYRKGGKETSEIIGIKNAMARMRKVAGACLVDEFGPLKLKAVRNHMIAKGLARTTVNQYTNRVRRMIRWATENELCPPSIYEGLRAVPSLQRGRTTAIEHDPVGPPNLDDVYLVMKQLDPEYQALIQLQLLTGMRPGEATEMRGSNLNTSGKVWIYRPASHKTEHLGKTREILIGPKAQKAIHPFLKPGNDRMFPILRTSYARVILRTCKSLKITHWTPNQLRHAAATRIRAEYGIESAQVILGHSTLETSLIYAEKNLAAARQIMLEIG